LEQDVERGERSVTARDVLLQVESSVTFLKDVEWCFRVFED